MNMKKKILSLIVFTLCVTFLGAGLVYADTNGCTISNLKRLPTTLTCEANCVYAANGDCGMCCLLNTVYNIIDWVFILLMALASLMIVLGAIMFTTSGGDAAKVDKAKQLIVFAAVGIVVALFARAIPPAINVMVGG